MGLSPSCQDLRPYLLVSVSEYTVINEACPGAEWNIMCRECCEYDQIECVCPGKKEVVGYTIPCCRNEENECDSCLIHPGECGTGDLRLPCVFWGHEREEAEHLNADRQPSGGCDAINIKSGFMQLILPGGIGGGGTLCSVTLVKLWSAHSFIYLTNRLSSS